ncbi:Panacea domain-containing protein [Zavarzinella formosa]|uniref:Panacea domain-containing protein n=1 Tax=Zavarzinella formosa TaxID=360055 RepID=UPI0002F471B3|nr:type II toxin-antitoxin system antitoxin SocA domain-containing protein [Zavarzinella formosa]
MVSAIDVARQFVILAGADGEPLNQMRLYKLMYYAQGWSMAWYLEPLFDDRIEAWKLGPVPKNIRRELQSFGDDPISGLGEPEALTVRARDLIGAVWNKFREFSGFGLSDRTHKEPPWRDAYMPDAGGRCSNAITNEALLAYFGRLYEQDTGEPPGGEARLESQFAEGKLVPLSEVIARIGKK